MSETETKAVPSLSLATAELTPVGLDAWPDGAGVTLRVYRGESAVQRKLSWEETRTLAKGLLLWLQERDGGAPA